MAETNIGGTAAQGHLGRNVVVPMTETNIGGTAARGHLERNVVVLMTETSIGGTAARGHLERNVVAERGVAGTVVEREHAVAITFLTEGSSSVLPAATRCL